MDKKININKEDFVSALKRGDEEAFTVLFKELNLPLSSYAYRILNDMDQSREVVQSTFFKIWDNRAVIDVNESLKSYMYKAVYNNCISVLRKSKRYEQFAELGLGDLYFNRILQKSSCRDEYDRFGDT